MPESCFSSPAANASSSAPPVALVTGSSRGLGRGIALELASYGMSVAIHYGSNVAAADETIALCRAAARCSAQKFHAIAGDLGSAKERDHVFVETLEIFGHVDALVNNAGIGSPGRPDITEATGEGFDTVMEVNLKAPFFLSQAAANYWIKNPEKSRLPEGYKLVFVSSISATTPSINRGDYCISKAAVGMVNQLWAVRLAEHGVQTIEFRPGIMETDMTSGVKDKYDPIIASGTVPQRRWGTGEDLGRAVRSFLQGQIPFTTGDHLYIDGGFSVRSL